MKQFLYRKRFFVLSVLFLSGLLVITLPVSNAVWREVLGVDGNMEIADGSTPTPLVVTATLTGTPLASPTAVLLLQAAATTPISYTATPSPEIIDPAATLETPTDVPSALPSPTDPAPTETPPANPSPIEESPADEQPPVELQTEPPVEEPTPGE